MPHVSKKNISNKISLKIEERLLRVVTGLNSKKSAMLFELLTITEKTMLAKRLGIVFMLTEKRSFYEISEKLGVSTSTVSRIEDDMKRGAFKRLRIYFEKHREGFWNSLEKFMRAGMPPIVGKGRWDYLKEMP
ncbi:MAG TPA: Trp family transcriptional regulator [Candidatus Paceibacterota bacterium]|nr:Trp family transcriptional regulator [Candidatus Paceibacterota bacterium]